MLPDGCPSDFLSAMCHAVSHVVFTLFSPQVRPHYPCRVLLSPVTHHSKSITKAVTVWSCVFLGLLLLLAGDVESNPGPRKGKEREASGQLLCMLIVVYVINVHIILYNMYSNSFFCGMNFYKSVTSN